MLVDKYRAKLAGRPDDGQANPVYAAMVEALDTAVGTVLNHLETRGLADKTLVIFTSDNGGIRAISAQTPLRGGKGTYYEGGIRVPMLARWPAKIAAGGVCRTPVTNLDLFPTLVHLAGGDPGPLALDGHDIATTFTDEADALLAERPLFWDFPVYLGAYDPNRDDGRDPLFRTRPGAVWREGPWKLHWYAEDDRCELYNLAADIGERSDLAASQPERMSAMRSRLHRHLTSLNADLAFTRNPVFDAAEEARLLSDVAHAIPPASTSEEEWYRVMRFID